MTLIPNGMLSLVTESPHLCTWNCLSQELKNCDPKSVGSSQNGFPQLQRAECRPSCRNSVYRVGRKQQGQPNKPRENGSVCWRQPVWSGSGLLSRPLKSCVCTPLSPRKTHFWARVVCMVGNGPATHISGLDYPRTRTCVFPVGQSAADLRACTCSLLVPCLPLQQTLGEVSHCSRRAKQGAKEPSQSISPKKLQTLGKGQIVFTVSWGQKWLLWF